MNELIKLGEENINLDRIRNTLKRNISAYSIYKGSNKTGGYYIKD